VTDDPFDRLLDAMLKIAEAVNAFASPDAPTGRSMLFQPRLALGKRAIVSNVEREVSSACSDQPIGGRRHGARVLPGAAIAVRRRTLGPVPRCCASSGHPAGRALIGMPLDAMLDFLKRTLH